MRVLLVMLISLGSFLSPYASPSAAQTGDALPADMLFTGLTAQTSLSTTLMRVDAQTLQASPFYVDEGSLLRALSWSPAGDLLAILRKPSIDADYLEICLLTRAGVLQSCFEDKIARYLFRERGKDYLLTWSEDGQYVYFVTDYDLFHWSDATPGGTWAARLVKAEVASGQTQEVLYQTPPEIHDSPALLFWADDLHYLQAGLTVLDLWQDTEITLPLDLPGRGDLMYCPRFSPQGQYLTARAIVDDALTGLALVSPTGQIIRTVGSDRLQQAGIEWMECPVWRSDETAFYFLGGLEGTAELFRYDLADDTFVHLKQLYPPDPQEAVFRGGSPHLPMRLAPDDATLAITFWENSATDIRILAPTNEWIIYGGVGTSMPVGASPIWMPPLPAPPLACSFTITAGDDTALISAINAANANPDPDTICLAAGSTYTLTAHHNTTFGANGLPPITTDITLVGNGATIARDATAPPFRLLLVSATGALTLDDVTLTGGLAGVADPGDNGGAVYNLGTLTLIDSAITASSANGDGGGIYNAGTLTLSEASQIEGNFAADDGGGIYSTAGAVIVTDSAIANNSVGDQGGGIRSVTSTVTLTNASLTGNSASSASGGGLYATSTELAVHGGTISGNVVNTGGGLYLTNSPSSAQIDGGVQIVNNSATSGGDLYLSEDGQAALTNVRVAGNQASSSSAGIRMGGTLTVIDSEISNNGSATQPGSGGGIRTSGALTIINSALTGNQVNSSSGLGAGIYVADGGTVSVIGGAVSDNHAYWGGRILRHR